MFNMLISFGGGIITATIIWYFVLKNNKKHFNEWIDGTEQYFMEALSKVDGIGEEASAKIDAIFAEFKQIKK